MAKVDCLRACLSAPHEAVVVLQGTLSRDCWILTRQNGVESMEFFEEGGGTTAVIAVVDEGTLT